MSIVSGMPISSSPSVSKNQKILQTKLEKINLFESPINLSNPPPPGTF